MKLQISIAMNGVCMGGGHWVMQVCVGRVHMASTCIAASIKTLPTIFFIPLFNHFMLPQSSSHPPLIPFPLPLQISPNPPNAPHAPSVSAFTRRPITLNCLTTNYSCNQQIIGRWYSSLIAGTVEMAQ